MVAADALAPRTRRPRAAPAMRLAKYLAHAGVASRRAAERLIGEGRVAVAGEVVHRPARDVVRGRSVEVDGRALAGAEQRVVYAVHKPVGVISTARDTHGRPRCVALVPARGLRLYPVGRLDADSSGLILLTNDGELANRLTHPRFEVLEDLSRARGRRRCERGRAAALRRGVELEDGVTAPARCEGRAPGARARARRAIAHRRPGAEVIELTIHEGRNRQVRRMCEAVGHPVLELQRVAFGPLRSAISRRAQHRLLRAPRSSAARARGRPASSLARRRGTALCDNRRDATTVRAARRHLACASNDAPVDPRLRRAS